LPHRWNGDLVADSVAAELAARGLATPKSIVDKIERALMQRIGKSLVNASVLLVGVRYKPDIADTRESAAVRVLKSYTSPRASGDENGDVLP
jgi:UDP-N-acetyl-D-mannosaminuronate dehydrogenase